MKQTTYADEETIPDPIVLEDFGFAPITIREGVAPASVQPTRVTEALDLFLAVIKWIFLYVPGAAALHFVWMGLGLFFYYGVPNIEILAGMLGGSVFAMFMVMLGIGRLNDLRYLRVVGAILATGALASILFSILILFIRGDYFGRFTLLTMPVTIIIGQLVKMKTDRESLPHE
jgi:hypothetical protein